MIMKNGFTLLEFIIVMAIIAILAALAVPSMKGLIGKAKRSECYSYLRAIAMAEHAYFATHDTFSTNLNEIGFKPEGEYRYTYGFSGADGKNYYTGELKCSGSSLTGSYASKTGFSACAAADIDGDGDIDILSIDEKGKISIIHNDL